MIRSVTLHRDGTATYQKTSAFGYTTVPPELLEPGFSVRGMLGPSAPPRLWCMRCGRDLWDAHTRQQTTCPCTMTVGAR